MRSLSRLVALPLLWTAASLSAAAADTLALSLAGTRSHSTAAEPVELALLYTKGGDYKKLSLEVKHADGSSLTFGVPFDVAAGKSQVRLVTLAAGSLKPG